MFRREIKAPMPPPTPPTHTKSKLRGICGHRQLRPCIVSLSSVLRGGSFQREDVGGKQHKDRRQDSPGSRE